MKEIVERTAISTVDSSPDIVRDCERLDFRLLFANRIVERSWTEHRRMWSRDDVGLLLMEVLEEEFHFDWSEPLAVDQFKELLVIAYVAAGDVLPVDQRTF